MNESGFFNENEDGEEDFSQAFERYLQAKENGDLESLQLSEDECEYVIDRLMEQDRAPEVLELSALAFERYPYSSAILARYCDTLILQGKADKALEILNLYMDSFDANDAIYLLLARAHIAHREFTHAREYFYKALECGKVDDSTLESICALALDCIDAQNYAEAIYYLNKVRVYEELPYEYYNDYAFCYDKLDDAGRAIEYYNKYLDANPFNDNVWFNLGTVQARKFKFDDAITSFGYAIALNGSNPSSLYNLAVVYMNLQRHREAAEYFERFIQLEADPQGRMGLAEAYIRLRRLEEARSQFGLLHQEHPELEDPHWGMEAIEAIVAFEKDDIEEFKKHFAPLVKSNTAWLCVVYDALPDLMSEDWYSDYFRNLIK